MDITQEELDEMDITLEDYKNYTADGTTKEKLKAYLDEIMSWPDPQSQQDPASSSTRPQSAQILDEEESHYVEVDL